MLEINYHIILHAGCFWGLLLGKLCHTIMTRSGTIILGTINWNKSLIDTMFRPTLHTFRTRIPDTIGHSILDCRLQFQITSQDTGVLCEQPLSVVFWEEGIFFPFPYQFLVFSFIFIKDFRNIFCLGCFYSRFYSWCA